MRSDHPHTTLASGRELLGTPDNDDRPIARFDDLLEPLHGAIKPRERFRVGTEAEKFGVHAADGTPIPYDGERSVAAVLRALCDRFGWQGEAETESGEVIALRRGDASITLEPGGQLELSGAPLLTIHETREELRQHMGELHAISEELQIGWLGLGFHPLATQDALPWVPKLRYGVMKRYLPTRGKYALDMMRRTATVQANIDFESEEDAIRKVRVSLALAPVITAMFANSPFVEGRATGERSHRAAVWLDVDNDRAGLLPFAWSETFRFVDYVEWALDVPMFMIKRDGRVLDNAGQTFRAYLQDGFGGARATVSDWLAHLNTLFPEVRLKRTIEFRGADSQTLPMQGALPALIKGLLYDGAALAQAETLAAPLRYDELAAARPAIARDGVHARLLDRPVLEWAHDVLRVAEDGLRRIGELDKQGRDESIHLLPLRRLLDAGQSPADALLEAVDPRAPLWPQLLHLARV